MNKTRPYVGIALVLLMSIILMSTAIVAVETNGFQTAFLSKVNENYIVIGEQVIYEDTTIELSEEVVKIVASGAFSVNVYANTDFRFDFKIDDDLEGSQNVENYNSAFDLLKVDNYFYINGQKQYLISILETMFPNNIVTVDLIDIEEKPLFEIAIMFENQMSITLKLQNIAISHVPVEDIELDPPIIVF